MRVARLQLTNVRPIEAAEFHFRPGFNLTARAAAVGNGELAPCCQVALWWLRKLGGRGVPR